jgi:hypothetical protein
VREDDLYDMKNLEMCRILELAYEFGVFIFRLEHLRVIVVNGFVGYVYGQFKRARGSICVQIEKALVWMVRTGTA